MNASLWERMHTVSRGDMESVLDSLKRKIKEFGDCCACRDKDWANKMLTANAFTRSLERQMQQFNRITANDQFWKELIANMRNVLDHINNMSDSDEYRQQEWDESIEEALDIIDDLEIYVVTTGDLNAIEQNRGHN